MKTKIECQFENGKQLLLIFLETFVFNILEYVKVLIA